MIRSPVDGTKPSVPANRRRSLPSGSLPRQFGPAPVPGQCYAADSSSPYPPPAETCPGVDHGISRDHGIVLVVKSAFHMFGILEFSPPHGGAEKILENRVFLHRSLALFGSEPVLSTKIRGVVTEESAKQALRSNVGGSTKKAPITSTTKACMASVILSRRRHLIDSRCPVRPSGGQAEQGRLTRYQILSLHSEITHRT